MIVLTADHLSFSFGVHTILQDVTFSLNENDRLGIIGVNGCGKSTLFRLLAGELTPDEGSVCLSKNKTLGILHQDDAMREGQETDGNATALAIMLRAFGDLLAAEERLAELEVLLRTAEGRERDILTAEFSTLNERFLREGGLEFRARCASALQKMGFDEEAQNRPFSSLSGGQRTRLALAREICREPDLLLLDEPTNHLDTETLTWLEGYLAAYPKCVIVISHDRYFLDRVTNKTLCLERCRAKLYNGNYTRSMAQRKADREVAERHYQNQQKEIARQEAYIAQQRAWNREKNIVAAESRQKMLDKMVKLERPQDAPKSIHLRFSSALPSGNEVLSVHDLSFGYGKTPLFSSLSFLIRRGECVFLTGANGCGKSTLIKLLLGKLTPTAGYAEAGYNVRLGYYDQENQNLNDANTVLEELWQAYPALTETELRNTLAQFRLVGDAVYETVGGLSGGERARLTLAKLILSSVNLLILDEPTNHLDIDSREALEEALSAFDGTVLTVSHDRYLIDRLATRILDFTPDGLCDLTVSRVGEGYEELCRERAKRGASNVAAVAADCAAPSSQPSSQKEQYLRQKQEQAEARRKKNRLERIRAEAKKWENTLAEVEKEMSSDAIAADYIRLAELDTQKNELEERLFALYAEEETLEEACSFLS